MPARGRRNSPQIVVVAGDGNQVSVGHEQIVLQITELPGEAEE